MVWFNRRAVLLPRASVVRLFPIFFFTSVSFYVLLMCGEVMTLDMQCIHKCSDAQTSEKGMGTLTEADSCFCQDDI